MPYTVNIKSMLIRNGYPKAYIDRCIMKYLNKKHETSVNSFTITPPMTTTINMRLPYLGEISYEVRREMQRLVHRYAITPSQFRFIHETNKLKKSFTYKDKRNHLRRSSVVYKLTCTCGSNYIGQTRRKLITRINEHKFDLCSEVCKHLLANPTHRFNFKQPEILGSIVSQKELHLLESLLIQQYQPDLKVNGSFVPLLLINT